MITNMVISMRKIDLSGIKHTRLMPVDSFSKKRRRYWHCICDCGKKTVVSSDKLVSGHTKSCGCLVGSERDFHSKSNTKIYRTWATMRDRCTNKNSPKFSIYGARGITICNEWEKSFVTFLSDMGDKPSDDYQIDRIDNNKGYYKENCRWVSRSVNQQNSRESKYWVVDNVKYESINDASSFLKVSKSTIRRWCGAVGNNGKQPITKKGCYSFLKY